MKEALNHWLTQQARTSGILACGIYYPDATSFSQSNNPIYTVSALEQAAQCLADTVRVIAMNRLPMHRLRWVYEHAVLLCAFREDGSSLFVFVVRDESVFPPTASEQLIAEFRAITGPIQTAS